MLTSYYLHNSPVARPNKLNFNHVRNRNQILHSFEFPTPIEEPRKILPAMYIGLVPVTKPTGVDVLNMAIEEMVSSLRLSLSDEHDETELMRPVNVHISPSNIVVECAETGATLVECRVRYVPGHFSAFPFTQLSFSNPQIDTFLSWASVWTMCIGAAL